MKYSPKDIKMAIGVASDKRYAGGNMTGAVKAIEKIKKGLSSHPQVAAVLKRQNEQKMKTFDELRSELAEGKAANPAQQAAIAIAKKEKEKSEGALNKKAVETGKVKTGASKSRMSAMQKQDDNRPTLRKNEEVKYPHMMYDPKTGKEVEAKSPEDHAKYAKMGYTHDKPTTEGKKMDSAAMKRAMDAFKKRGGKVKKVAPGKAAGYHGKDDPGADVQGMMDRGDTKGFNRKKKVKSMGK